MYGYKMKSTSSLISKAYSLEVPSLLMGRGLMFFYKFSMDRHVYVDTIEIQMDMYKFI